MEFKFIKDEKNEAQIELDNLTIAEVLRAYLIKDEAVTFAAWRRDHPTKNPLIGIKTKGKTVKKAIQDAIAEIEKDADKVVEAVKKSK